MGSNALRTFTGDEDDEVRLSRAPWKEFCHGIHVAHRAIDPPTVCEYTDVLASELFANPALEAPIRARLIASLMNAAGAIEIILYPLTDTGITTATEHAISYRAVLNAATPDACKPSNLVARTAELAHAGTRMEVNLNAIRFFGYLGAKPCRK